MYYTIPFKTDGSCCPTCPVVQGCDCDEGCCDPTASYTGKSVTFTYDRFQYSSFGGPAVSWDHRLLVSPFAGVIGNFPRVGCTAAVFAAGGTSELRSGNIPTQSACYTHPAWGAPTTSVVTQIEFYCCAATPARYDIRSGGNELTAFASGSMLGPNCGYPTGCNSGVIHTCATSYSSSCFSAALSYQECWTYYNAGCTIWAGLEFTEVYITLSIA